MQGELNGAFETDIADPHRDFAVSQTSLSDSGFGHVTPVESESSLDPSQHDHTEQDDTL